MSLDLERAAALEPDPRKRLQYQEDLAKADAPAADPDEVRALKAVVRDAETQADAIWQKLNKAAQGAKYYKTEMNQLARLAEAFTTKVGQLRDQMDSH
jgi:uncharacterized coiled-coil DUF342 family protein